MAIATAQSLMPNELRHVELFAALPREDLEELVAGAVIQRFDRKQTILPPDDKHDGIVVARGLARLHRLAQRGPEVTIALLGPGDCYLLPVAAPTVRCTCRLEASRDGTVVYRLPGRALRALVTRDLAMADRVLTLAAQTVTMLSDRLEEHAIFDVVTRLARLLAQLATEPDEPILITHQELAGLIGTTQTQVTKGLRKLRREGLIASIPHRSGIVVLRQEQLARYGE